MWMPGVQRRVGRGRRAFSATLSAPVAVIAVEPARTCDTIPGFAQC